MLLTSGDLHGLAHVWAVQLPDQHHLARLQAKDVLLLGLAHSHLEPLAVQVHCGATEQDFNAHISYRTSPCSSWTKAGGQLQSQFFFACGAENLW